MEPNIGRISQIRSSNQIVACAYKVDVSEKMSVVTEYCFGEGASAQRPVVAAALYKKYSINSSDGNTLSILIQQTFGWRLGEYVYVNRPISYLCLHPQASTYIA